MIVSFIHSFNSSSGIEEEEQCKSNSQSKQFETNNLFVRIRIHELDFTILNSSNPILYCACSMQCGICINLKFPQSMHSMWKPRTPKATTMLKSTYQIKSVECFLSELISSYCQICISSSVFTCIFPFTQRINAERLKTISGYFYVSEHNSNIQIKRHLKRVLLTQFTFECV